MEEFIKYFYNICVVHVFNNEDKIVLMTKTKKYQLINFYKNPDELYKKYLILKNNGVCCHDIILNKDGNILTIYNNKNYLLLKVNINSKGIINEKDLINCNLIEKYEETMTTKNKWQIKNDYYEEEISKIYRENEYIKESFDYYLGLGELAISLLNYINFNNIKYYPQHNRLKYNEKLEDYFNPINIVIDSKVRDIALYIKSSFFKNAISFDKIKNILALANLNSDEIILLIARLIYPDYYFDICEEILNENYNGDKLKKCIKKNTSYEIFLKKIYNYLYKIYNIPKINFLSTLY